MRGHLYLPLAPVLFDDTVKVDREASVRVDGDAEQPRVGLKYIVLFGNIRGSYRNNDQIR